MSAGQRIAAVLGAALAALGLVALVAPGILGSLPTDRALVLVLGVLLVLGAVREINRRRKTERLYAETPDAEEVVELPTPGDAFDERFAHLSRTRYRVTERKRIREELGDLTEETLVRRQGLAPEEARAAMREGTWTDDPYAAAMFSADSPRIGTVARVREFFGSRSAFHHRVGQVADELARLVDDPQGATATVPTDTGDANAATDDGPEPELATVFGAPDAGEGEDG
ncbi:MAG: hypothetical protein V5A28_02670 [Haloarculaceae archaeon]